MSRTKTIDIGSPASVPAIEPQDILTLREVSRRLKVSDRWVYEKTRRRTPDPLPVIRIGRYVRFHWPTIVRWLHAHSNVADAA